MMTKFTVRPASWSAEESALRLRSAVKKLVEMALHAVDECGDPQYDSQKSSRPRLVDEGGSEHIYSQAI